MEKKVLLDVLFLFLFLIVIVTDIKKDDVNDNFGFSLEKSDLIRGGAAVIILLHHISQRANGVFWKYMGVPGVGVFMFTSGYGIMNSYLMKEKYCKRILFDKIPQMLKMMVFTIVISACFYFAVGDPATKTDYLCALYGNKLLNWFFGFLIIKYEASCMIVGKSYPPAS